MQPPREHDPGRRVWLRDDYGQRYLPAVCSAVQREPEIQRYHCNMPLLQPQRSACLRIVAELNLMRRMNGWRGLLRLFLGLARKYVWALLKTVSYGRM